MQSRALELAAAAGLQAFDPRDIPPHERPNHRMILLRDGGYREAVAQAQADAVERHGSEEWWRPKGPILLSPEAMDGEAAESSMRLQRELLEHAGDLLRRQGAGFVAHQDHHSDLQAVLTQARELAPQGLARIGSLLEGPGGELLHGGPLDSQIIELQAAPRRAVVLPYGSASAACGEGAGRHVFIVVTSLTRIRAAHEVEGVSLPDSEVVAVARSTVFDGERRDSLLLLDVEGPEVLQEVAPVYVCVFSSAAAAAPEHAAAWMRFADPERLSLVMDTPVSAAIARWCADGARFHTETRAVRAEDQELRFIVGRIRKDDGQSALVIIPTTEFGARWFEAVRAEDPLLGEAVIDEPSLFERESPHMDVVLNHLLWEERALGAGSWRY